jgi:hypothetical protein
MLRDKRREAGKGNGFIAKRLKRPNKALILQISLIQEFSQRFCMTMFDQG